ncbi:MAG TPA: Hsp20/alpha crystallin family protein [Firmicutes bacterium]|nr:Hsp20/alpha crystallin family protein [Bacillota bacterium]
MPDIERWDPWRNWREIQQEAGRWLGVVPWWRPVPEESRHRWEPSVDVYETDRDVVVTAEVPGMRPEDLNVNVRHNVLTIAGRTSEERDEETASYHRRERRWGSFHRSFELPAEVDPERTTAEYRRGVLEVHLPKVEEAGYKNVRVQVKNEG